VTAVQPADWLLMADRTAFMWLVVGLCAGLAPFGCLLIINAGMARAYWEKKVMTILRRGRTNLRLPLPWIWAWHVPQLNRLDLPRRWFFKSVFTASPLIYGGIIAGYAVSPTRSDQPTMELAVVASCTGLVYLHHVLSRADVAHMSQALHPLLIAICAAVSVLVPSHWAILLVLLLACSSAWALLPHFDERFQFLVARTRYRRFSTSAETLRLHQRTAAQLTYLGHLIDRHSRKGEAIFAAPQLAGFFPLFERSPAAYDTFPVYPASRSEQLSMIEQLERANTRMAIIRDVPVDRREDLRFSSNYDLVFEYLQKKFHKLPNNDLIENYFVFVSHDHRSIT
jgi:hypothetical protein